MATPTTLIERVDERCEINGDELVRDIKLSVKLSGKNSLTIGDAMHREPFLVDVVHPKKGSLSKLQAVSASVPYLQLSHDEHRDVSRAIIRHRAVSFLNSSNLACDDEVRQTFLIALSQVATELETLPFVDASDGRHLIKRHFDLASGVPRACLETKGWSLEETKVVGFYNLCVELAERYLVLIELEAPRDGGSFELNYRYKYRPSEDQTIAQHGTFLRVYRRLRSRFAAGRHRLYGTFPNSFMIHTPWARRTNDYRLTVDAPENFFFSRAVPLGDRPDGGRRPRELSAPAEVLKDTDEGASWSISTTQGRRLDVFIGDGPREGRRLYVGLQNLELPGRSTARAANLAWLTAIALYGFLFLTIWTSTDVASTIAAMAGVLALGNFSFGTFLESSRVGRPLIARFVPSALSVAAGVFVVWVLSRSATLTLPGALGQRDLVEGAWSLWQHTAGLAVATVSLTLAVWIEARRSRLRQRFGLEWRRDVTMGGPLHRTRPQVPERPETASPRVAETGSPDASPPAGDPVSKAGEWVPKGGSLFLGSQVFDPDFGTEQDGLDDAATDADEVIAAFLDEILPEIGELDGIAIEKAASYFDTHPKKLARLLRLATSGSHPEQPGTNVFRYVVDTPGELFLEAPDGTRTRISTESEVEHAGRRRRTQD